MGCIGRIGCEGLLESGVFYCCVFGAFFVPLQVKCTANTGCVYSRCVMSVWQKRDECLVEWGCFVV